MASAKYTIHIPTKDNLGNPLADIARAAHHHLFYGPARIDATYIEPGKRGNWKDDPEEIMDHLVSFADDHPENDGAFKQLAAHVGDIANQWGVFVSKEGKGGPQTWIINNPKYRPGEPAEALALANPDEIQTTGPDNHPAPHAKDSY